MHGHTAYGLHGMKCNDALPHYLEDIGNRTFSVALPHRRRAAGGENGAVHCHIAWGQQVVELLRCTSTLPPGTGQWNCCNAPPYRLWVAGKVNATMHYHTAWRNWAMKLDAVPRGNGQPNWWKAIPHCLRAVGSGIAAMHCHIPRAQSSLELL